MLELKSKADKLALKLNILKASPLEGGWEKLFLANLVVENKEKFFFGISLRVSRKRKRNGSSSDLKFDATKRETIIDSLIKSLGDRLDTEIVSEEHLRPLSKLSSTMSCKALEYCHLYVIPDLNRESFYEEYFKAAEVLGSCKNPYTILQKLHNVDAAEFSILKTALARAIVCKPHTSDVERLISNSTIQCLNRMVGLIDRVLSPNLKFKVEIRSIKTIRSSNFSNLMISVSFFVLS